MKYNDEDYDFNDLDLNKDMEIDESALDVECLRQPKLAFVYGANLSHCKKRHAESWEKVKTMKAGLIEKVNSNPEKYTGENKKPTAPVMEAFYRNNKKYRQAKADMIQAEYEANIAFYAFQEISYTRKKMLENLIQLHSANYFAGPSVPRDLSTESLKQKEQKERDSGVSSKIKRRKK